MKTLQRIALALIIIGAINWGLIGLFQFDLVAAVFGGQGSGLSRIVYTLVGLSGLISLGLLFDRDTVDVTSPDRQKGLTADPSPQYATEFAEEPDLDQLYNPSRDAYDSMNKTDREDNQN